MQFKELPAFSALNGRFTVALSWDALSVLLTESAAAYRVPELLAIQLPRDLYRYIQVIPQCLPERLEARGQRDSYTYRREGWLPLDAFTSWFSWGDSWDGADPEDAAWLGFLDANEQFRESVLSALFNVHRAQQELRASPDRLVNLELSLWDTHQHPQAWSIPEKRVATSPNYSSPTQFTLSEAGLSKLNEWLVLPSITTATLRGLGRYPLIKALCAEQHRRSQMNEAAPFRISALASFENIYGADRSPNWASRLHYFAEGIHFGELHIEDRTTATGQCNRRSLPSIPWLVLINDVGERPAGYEWEDIDEFAFGRRQD